MNRKNLLNGDTAKYLITINELLILSIIIKKNFTINKLFNLNEV